MDNPETLITLSFQSTLRILRLNIPAMETANGQPRETSNIEYTLHRTNITF
jgi:hypothetical protein